MAVTGDPVRFERLDELLDLVAMLDPDTMRDAVRWELKVTLEVRGHGPVIRTVGACVDDAAALAYERLRIRAGLEPAPSGEGSG